MAMPKGRALLVSLGVISLSCAQGRLVTPDRAVSPGGAQTSNDPVPPAPSAVPSAPATPLPAPAPGPKKRVVIIAGRLFDAKAAKLVSGPHAIVIEGDRI